MSRGAAQPGTVSALRRGIAVLQCFTDGTRTLSNGEISARIRVPRPTVTRLAATLVSLGLMRQDPETERFSLGAGVLSLAQAFLAGLDVRAHARAAMQALAETSGGSVFLGVRDGLDMVLIEACRARGSVLTLRLDVGSRVALASSALGRAYLGALEPGERERLVAQLRGAAGDGWRRLAPSLEAALADAAQSGYCVSLGEVRPEVNSIAAALRLPDGECVALNCGGPAFEFTEARLRREIAPRLLAAAAAIAREVGGTVPRMARELQSA